MLLLAGVRVDHAHVLTVAFGKPHSSTKHEGAELQAAEDAQCVIID